MTTSISHAPETSKWRGQALFMAMLIGQFLAMLDVQIVASSVDAIRSNLSMTNDEVSWIQTSYLIAEIVAIPLAGYWIRLSGPERVYCLSCFAFVPASVATGSATTLEALIIGRAIQGFVGGAMLPTVFAFAFSRLPERDRPRSSLMLSLAATIAPALGPAIGGVLTDAAGWRWLFLMNVVPGLISATIVLVLGWRAAPTNSKSGYSAPFDWAGIALLSVLLVSLQYILEEGPAESWLDSDAIIIAILICIGAAIILSWHLLGFEAPIIDLRPLRDRNFILGLGMIAVSGIALLGGTFLLPLFFADILHYSPSQIGGTVFLSGAVMFATGLILGKRLHRVDPRISIAFGFGIAAIGFATAGHVTAAWHGDSFAAFQICRGIGIMIAATAVQTSMMSTLPSHLVASASSLVYLARNLGGALGLAAVSSLMDRFSAEHMATLSTQLGQAANQTAEAILSLQDRLGALGRPVGTGVQIYHQIVAREALLMAYRDCFLFLTIGSSLAACLGLLLRRPAQPAIAPPPQN
jgi:MFS transporter, DHA2 family, multidrug resistance protein